MYSTERRYVEEAAVVLEGMGLPRAYGKLLAWLLICDPPQQSSTELAEALELSKGSVSAGTRMLESAGLIRRVAVPGRRGKVYELTDDGIIRAADTSRYRAFRELMDRGLAVVGPDVERGRRVRLMRDFYSLMEQEIPRLIEKFTAEHEEYRHG